MFIKPELFNQEVNKMFSWFTNESSPGLLRLELEVYKKLLNFFVIGDSYYFGMNHYSLSFDFVSKEIEDVLGYKPSELSFQLLNERLHPDDQPWVLSYGHKMIGFFSQLPV